MIPRYEDSQIAKIWSDEYKFNKYLEVELAILKAQEGEKIPSGTAQKIKNQASISLKRIEEIEAVTKHDVIAFCTSITENISPEVGKFFHFGVTSSDIIDSALTLQIKDSLEVVLPEIKRLKEAIYQRSIEMKQILTIGRSHGMYAEPMSFGQKLLGHYAEIARRESDIIDFYNNELTVQLSGAVGNYTIISTEEEKKAALELGVKVEPHSTQVIPRDRIAKLVALHGLMATAIERLSVEIRHLHRSDVGELHEGFKKGQKGSSIMPHKKNPISGENLTGMARVLRSHVQISMDNIVLWHERDISHSGAERLYLPDNFGIMVYSLKRMTDTVQNLCFHHEVIEGRLKEDYNYLSSFYLHHLLLTANLSREDNYALVQQASFKGRESGSAEVFHQELTKLTKEKGVELDLPLPTFEQIKKIYTKETDNVFSRVMSSYPL